jgi:hypothetical protein
MLTAVHSCTSEACHSGNFSLGNIALVWWMHKVYMLVILMSYSGSDSSF